MSASLRSNAAPGTETILVTGGTGLVGSHLIQELLRQKKNITALYRNHLPDQALTPKVLWIKGDVLDITSLEEAFAGVIQVYHCAAIVSYNPARKQQMYQVNIEGTANVVNACLSAGVQQLCFLSSVAALGRLHNGDTINETTTWTKETSNSSYGKSKYLAEMEVWRGVGEGLNAVVVNPSVILGTGDWTKGSSGLFKSAYDAFPWYTEGVTGFVDVMDVVYIITALMEKKITGEHFIISSENCTYKEVFTAMAKAFGKKPPYKKVSPFMAAVVWRMQHLKSLYKHSDPLLTKETATAAQAIVRYDNTKLLTRLPFFTYTPIAQTINRVCMQLLERYT